MGSTMPGGAAHPIAWGPLLTGMAAGASLIGVIVWRVNLRVIEQQIHETRTGLKRLVISKGIQPTQEVMDYLTARQTALDARYRYWLETVSAPALADAAKADPQLYFQQRFHEVQRTLERQAAARKVTTPEQLGFPKDLPPSDTVPRLLAQLSMLEELSTLVLERGVTSLASVKIEDPESVPDEDGKGVFLTRLPVRLRFTSSLPRLLDILSAIGRSRPTFDLRTIRVGTAAAPDELEVELALSRYLVAASSEPSSGADAERAAPLKGTKKRRERSGSDGKELSAHGDS